MTRTTNPELSRERLSRLRWRCRRGMLENDLVLERFLALRGDAITEDEVAMLDRLLNLPDQERWCPMVARTEPADPAAAPLVAALRSPDRSSPTEETR